MWIKVKYDQQLPAIETDCEAFIFAFGHLSVRPIPLQRWANWLLGK